RLRGYLSGGWIAWAERYLGARDGLSGVCGWVFARVQLGSLHGALATLSVGRMDRMGGAIPWGPGWLVRGVRMGVCARSTWRTRRSEERGVGREGGSHGRRDTLGPGMVGPGCADGGLSAFNLANARVGRG